jgi:hypothetical protein
VYAADHADTRFYLLCWYKSTNTDAAALVRSVRTSGALVRTSGALVRSVAEIIYKKTEAQLLERGADAKGGSAASVFVLLYQ